MKIERSVTTQAGPEKVFAYLSDFTTTEEWDPPTVSTVRTSGDGGVGTTYKNVSKFLGKETEVDYEVTELEPNRRFVLVGKAPSLDLRDTITFEETDGETSVTYHAEMEPQGAAKLANPLLDGGLELLGTHVAKSLQEKLEAL